MGEGRVVTVDTGSVLLPEEEDFIRMLAIAVQKLGGELLITQKEYDDLEVKLGFDLDYTREHAGEIRLYTTGA